MCWVLILLFLVGCVGEQSYRVDEELETQQEVEHAQRHSSEKVETVAREKDLVERAALKTASDTAQRFEESHKAVLRTHQVDVEDSVRKILKEQIGLIAASVSGLSNEFKEYKRALDASHEKANEEEKKHITEIDSKLAVMGDRVTGAVNLATELGVEDKFGDEERGKAIDRLSAAELTIKELRVTNVTQSREIASLQDSSDELLTSLRGAKESVETANAKSLAGILTAVGAVLAGALKWWSDSRKEKKGG